MVLNFNVATDEKIDALLKPLIFSDAVIQEVQTFVTIMSYVTIILGGQIRRNNQNQKAFNHSQYFNLKIIFSVFK